MLDDHDVGETKARHAQHRDRHPAARAREPHEIERQLGFGRAAVTRPKSRAGPKERNRGTRRPRAERALDAPAEAGKDEGERDLHHRFEDGRDRERAKIFDALEHAAQHRQNHVEREDHDRQNHRSEVADAQIRSDRRRKRRADHHHPQRDGAERGRDVSREGTQTCDVADGAEFGGVLDDDRRKNQRRHRQHREPREQRVQRTVRLDADAPADQRVEDETQDVDGGLRNEDEGAVPDQVVARQASQTAADDFKQSAPRDSPAD